MGDDENIGGDDAEMIMPSDGNGNDEAPAGFDAAPDEALEAPAGNETHSLDLQEIRSDDQGQQNEDGTSELEIGGMEFELEDAVDYEIPEKPGSAADLEALYDIPVQLAATLGMTTLQVDELLKLGRGAVVELDRKVGEAIDIYVNNRLVARGEVVVVDDKLGVTMTEIIKTGNN